MLAILERERPWIEIFYPRGLLPAPRLAREREADSGLSIPTYQYLDIDTELRARRRREWNEPTLLAALRAGGGGGRSWCCPGFGPT